MLSLDDIERARRRIAPHIRATPMMAARALKDETLKGLDIVMKLECLQATGSFKARGAMSKLLSLEASEVRRGLVTASGGNHGAAVAFAGWSAGVPAAIYVPDNVSPLKREKIRSWGAELIVEGAVWDEANRAALARAERDGMTYLHPFADPAIVAGNGTVALEVLEVLPDVDTLLIAIGGGGLVSGMAVAAKAKRPGVRVIGIEPEGCPTMKASLEAGEVVTLERVDTKVPTMAARRTDAFNLAICQTHLDEVVLVSDEAMEAAARTLWMELGLAADLSGAASIAALMTGAYRPDEGETVCALVCGAGSDGIIDHSGT